MKIASVHVETARAYAPTILPLPCRLRIPSTHAASWFPRTHARCFVPHTLLRSTHAASYSILRQRPRGPSADCKTRSLSPGSPFPVADDHAPILYPAVHATGLKVLKRYKGIRHFLSLCNRKTTDAQKKIRSQHHGPAPLRCPPPPSSENPPAPTFTSIPHLKATRLWSARRSASRTRRSIILKKLGRNCATKSGDNKSEPVQNEQTINVCTRSEPGPPHFRRQ